MLNAILTAAAAQAAMAPAVSLRSDPYSEGLALSAKGHHAEAISHFERALAQNPADVRVLFALGNTARALGMAEAAERFLVQVLALEPGRIEATVNLANLLRAQGRYAQAEAQILTALSHHPDSPEAWLTLGSICRETGRTAEALDHYAKALQIRPDSAIALGNLADLRADMGAEEEALSLYAQAIRRDPANAQLRLNRAMLHLSMGRLREGWRDYEARLKLPGKTIIRDHRLAPWDGGRVPQRLLAAAEQGIGDQIMFASLIPDLAARARKDGGTIVLECEPRLVQLFARSFEGVIVRPSAMENRGGQTFAHYGWLRREGGASRVIEMGSLPRMFRRDLCDFPQPHAYLVPDSGRLESWRSVFGARGPRTGICWRSGKTGGERTLQYAPLEAWGEFLRALPGKIVCAQYDAADDEISRLEKTSGRKIAVPQGLDQKNEIDATAAMLCALDCVVSAPTAVSWLSAACGVPTFKILYDRSWTSFGRDCEPFAPACRCMMPARAGDWREVFERTLEAIRSRP